MKEGSRYDLLTELEKKKVTNWINIKKGSIYFALNKLLIEGHIYEKEVIVSGLYPEKTIYQITDSGRIFFDKLQEKAFLGLFPYYYGFKMALKFNIRRTKKEILSFAEKKWIRQALIEYNGE